MLEIDQKQALLLARIQVRNCAHVYTVQHVLGTACVASEGGCIAVAAVSGLDECRLPVHLLLEGKYGFVRPVCFSAVHAIELVLLFSSIDESFEHNHTSPCSMDAAWGNAQKQTSITSTDKGWLLGRFTTRELGQALGSVSRAIGGWLQQR
ncbi:unnamed protein product [Periconia digitata]|uniref:Uncharacterized protein n=1 Tax=Periconia digitata TaxID=1303443 RepID=A0A9W4U2W1_9PLEO|nr:unnamed protein product [Periconia digitata]